MRYNGAYFALFRGTMKKTLAERYGTVFASETMRKAAPLYRKIVREADDLGRGNPMAYNELFALAFVAPYLACGKRITLEDVQEMMRRSLGLLQNSPKEKMRQTSPKGVAYLIFLLYAETA